MPQDLKSIKGISVKTEKKLLDVSINDVNLLRLATETPENRKDLSKRTNLSLASVYNWSKQAQLMRVEGISANDAALLVQCGIRDIEDLKEADTEGLLGFIKAVSSKAVDIKRPPTLEEINRWQQNAKTLTSTFEKDEDDQKNKYIFSTPNSESIDRNYLNSNNKDKNMKESGFFSDLSEVITEIGVGIAGAQHALDLSSIDIQNTILKDEELAAYGINATWYTIPEVNFDLKMEYMMMEESTESGSKPKSGSLFKRMYIGPSNAKYNNYFKSSMTGESTLSLRFVPLPPPERFTERIIMPDLIGMSKEEAEEELGLDGILIKGIEIIRGKTSNEKNSQVTYQSIMPGKIVLINEKPELKVTLDE